MENKYLRAMRNTLYTAPEKIPYCRACHKEGLSREEYTSHWTRKTVDPDSEITCPFILKSVCGYCKEKGHWKKFCPKRKLDELILEEYKSASSESDKSTKSQGKIFRPSSPTEPPPWLNSEQA